MIRIQNVILLLCVCLLGACVSTPKDPNITTDSRWIGGAISLEARKLDDHTYEITAQGAGSCKEHHVMKAWVYMADKMAAGRSYDKNSQTQPYNYAAPSPYGETHHTGLMITGRISLK